MTAEQRAAKIIENGRWVLADHESEANRFGEMNVAVLERDIADAIRAAEDAMRERCAQVAYDTVQKYEAAIKAVPVGQSHPYWYVVAGAVRHVGDAIRETGNSAAGGERE